MRLAKVSATLSIESHFSFSRRARSPKRSLMSASIFGIFFAALRFRRYSLQASGALSFFPSATSSFML